MSRLDQVDLAQLRARYQDYIERWLAGGRDVTEIQCPHCKKTYDVPLIPDTDTACTCIECGELFFKVIDIRGCAHGLLPDPHPMRGVRHER